MPRRRPADSSSRGTSRRCRAEGCAAGTRDDMPFCSEHLDRMPYVARLQAQLAARREDERRELERA